MKKLPFLSRSAGSLAACLLVLSIGHVRAAGDAASTDTDDTVIAKVGDSQVTAGQIRAALQNMDATTQAAAAHDPATLAKIVRTIVAQQLILKEALAKKWDQDPSVTAALERLRQSAVTQTYLQNVSKPADTYPSDEEVQQVYDNNKPKLVVPLQFQVAQIFVKDPKGSDADTDSKAKVKVDTIKKALAKKSADFPAIATADSDDAASAAKGGELGWLFEARIQPEIRAQLGTLSKGTVSQPLRLDDGYHFVKVLDIKQPYTPPLDQIKTQLVAKMRQEKAQSNSQDYIAKLLQENPVQINELELSKVIKQ